MGSNASGVLPSMAPIMFMRRMMRPTILCASSVDSTTGSFWPTPDDWHPAARQRETRADRQRGEKAVERGDTHALVRPCLRLEENVELVDFLIRKRRIQRHAQHLRLPRASVPLRSCHRYRAYVKPARGAGCPHQTCAHNLPPESVDNRRPSPRVPLEAQFQSGWTERAAPMVIMTV